ncbi:glutamate-rich WD repeat-containing protein 1 isoform X1 [Formica exsecta]|uniref:glutamate-rich WD repeat-containing protein 1 isoform X1 n=2 Tax=Formica exsecta TaxID=72781 RepID=UPI0011424782|nr:glutamate-rich WD repeat-containing protein 1 isoform X1 [Formica exsecta]XP_029672092.1 glutamate-rich WD repeat-containing protein 1 isoform X2 [Formica exsecta]XP_029672094.1 glutamate-rich WD repeat-containing protein 1 isoform X1 [Formica exsecta]
MPVYSEDIPEEMEEEPMEGVANEDESSESSDDESMENTNENQKETESKVYLPGQTLEEGEELVADKSAYRLLHHAQSGAPCLSFDIIPDDLGNCRESYPLTMYIVAGTQAAKTHVNNLLVMKMSNLHGTRQSSEDSESESSDSEDENDEHRPVMNVAPIRHHGCVNRVRCTKLGETKLAASWSELGRVNIWNLQEQLNAVENPSLLTAYRNKCDKTDGGIRPLYTFKGHLSEGFGLDWSCTEAGTLASGDCKGNIHIWRIDSTGAFWHVDQRPYNSHAPHSVEDLQWSPNEKNVLASCSVDKSIKIWDTRASPQNACMLTASGTHAADINVISWNPKESQFIISGGDDGLLCVWDLRQFGANGASPVATFKQHIAPVTSVEWHPTEATVFASGGADDVVTQWDLSVEVDHTEEPQDNELAKLPPQLLFIHQGQSDIKELHWHPQCPGTMISTAHSGFNIFRTISI